MNLNTRRLSLFMGAAFLLGGGIIFNSFTTEERYYPRKNSYFTQKAGLNSGYKAYMESIKNNRAAGSISYQEVAEVQKAVGQLRKNDKALDITWRFKGPDNVGGRTRAIAVDRNNSNHLIVGAVSGGLWESFNRATSWQPYDLDFKIKNVSAIAQAIDGTFYVGTGAGHDGIVNNNKNVGSRFVGSGLYKLTGNGGSEFLIGPSSVNNLEAWSLINEIAVDPNDADHFFVAMGSGLRETKDGGQSFSDPANFIVPCHDVHMSGDGKVIASYAGGSIRVSSDNGVTWDPVTDFFGVTDRVELAIAPSNSNIMYASAANLSGCLRGVYKSLDGGMTWNAIPFTPNFFSNSISCQGDYDNEIAVFPSNQNKIIVGGITAHVWEQSSVDPAPLNGGWTSVNDNFNPNDPRYIHSDIHKFVFDPNNPDVMYVGSDGGIGMSTDINADIPREYPTFSAENFGYNVTQFYDIGVNSQGIVLGGTQDNGSILVGMDFNTGNNGVDARGGDGFDSELFTINPSLGIASLYFGNIQRVQGIATTFTESNLDLAEIYTGVLANTCTGDQCNASVFYTCFGIWESFNHTKTKDSVNVRLSRRELPPIPIKQPDDSSATTIAYQSKNGNMINPCNLEGTLTAPLYPIDTLYEDLVPMEMNKIGIDTTGIVEFESTFDLIRVDTNTNTIIFNRHSYDPDTISYAVGQVVSWNNVFADAPGSLGNPLKLTVYESEVWYERLPLTFEYSIDFPDIVQSMVAIANVANRANLSGREIWMSRDILKGSNVNEPRWFKIGNCLAQGDNALVTKFSPDGNHLFVGTAGGSLYRIDNLNDIDISQISITAPDNFVIDSITSCKLLTTFSGSAVTGIAIDPKNSDNMIVTLGNYGVTNHVSRTTTATQAQVNFEFIDGIGSDRLPAMPAYDAMIDYTDSSYVLIATEFGVFGTNNAFDTTRVSGALDVKWTEENFGMGRAPAMSIHQVTTPPEFGAINQGKIYVGTHGRGIFVTDQFVGIDDIADKGKKSKEGVQNLSVFPNPLRDNATIEVTTTLRDQMTLQVYNLRGQMVKELTYAKLIAGKNSIRVDFSGLSTGAYIVRTIQKGSVTTSKFIKQ